MVAADGNAAAGAPMRLTVFRSQRWDERPASAMSARNRSAPTFSVAMSGAVSWASSPRAILSSLQNLRKRSASRPA